MRHLKRGKKLNRATKHRQALFKNLIQSLILNERIETTEAKAKSVKPLVDRLISKAKSGSLHVRRQIMAFLPSKKAAHKLVDEIAPRFRQEMSGFTKLIRLGRRRGDNAVIVELGLTKETQEAKAKKGQDKQEKIKSKTK